MKHICSIYFILIFSLTAQIVWGQKPDSTTKYPTVVSDRLNEVNERERGPSQKKILETAFKNFGKKNYFAAMKYYSFVLQDDSLHVEALTGYGESAFEIASLDIADTAFQRLVNHGLSPSPDYSPKMRLAEVKFRKGEYDKAYLLFHDLATVPQVASLKAEQIKIAIE
ncbi:MAG: hypothetical protein Q7T20_03215, partial [Saprospiraceae bacterium]|nr:hypothetical protein [Saprospiraceae bacterium]